eukprot:3704197-Amphidinium_carterae.2
MQLKLVDSYQLGGGNLLIARQALLHILLQMPYATFPALRITPSALQKLCRAYDRPFANT